LPFQQKAEQGHITIVYNLDNCLECNRYIPEMVKRSLPTDYKNYQFSLITRKTRVKELDVLRKQLELPVNTLMLADNQKLDEVFKKHKLKYQSSSIQWRSFMVIENNNDTKIIIVDSQKPVLTD
jgi:hypothetical protein